MGKASRRKRKAREWKQAVLAELQSKTREAGTRVVTGHSGPKVSVALGELIQPYLYGNLQIEEYRKLAMIGALAWNFATLPERTAEDRLQSLLEGVEASEEAALRALLDEMKERKHQLFPNDQRLIVQTEVRAQPDGRFYLAVAADVPEEAVAELRR